MRLPTLSRSVALLGMLTTPFLLSTATNAQCPAPTWSPIGAAADGSVRSAIELPNGDLVVGGSFTAVGGVAANCVARWDGSSWFPLGTGMSGGFFTSVNRLRLLANGDVLAGGEFTTAGGASAVGIARWNGTSWSAFGAPLGLGGSWTVHDAVEKPNGHVVIALHWFPPSATARAVVMQWNGTSWAILGTSTAGGPFSFATCNALLLLQNGDLVVGGEFTNLNGTAVNNIARWSGTWAALGTGTNLPVFALAGLPNGDVAAGGRFYQAGHYSEGVARWDGTSWHAMANGTPGWVRSLLPTSRGTLLAGGYTDFPAMGTYFFVSRWDGTNWTPLTPSIWPAGYPTTVEAVVELSNGDVLAGGTLWIGGVVASLVRRRPCPSAAFAFATGCPSSGGANMLNVSAPPLLNATFRALGQGLPSTAIVVAVSSVTPLAPSLQLSSAFAQAPTGCDLHVAPDILQILLTTSGSVESSLFLPAAPALLGATFYHQMVPFELDAVGNFVAITATDALRLTIGAD